MPSPKKASTRLAPLARAILLPLALLAAGLVGCGGSNSGTVPPLPTPPSNEVAINALSISQGVLTPPFSKSVANYGATLYTDGSGFRVTAVLSDPAAKLTIAGAPALSGQPTAVSLKEGITAVHVVAESEDGRRTVLNTITVVRAPLTTKVWVLNSLGGVPPEDIRLTLKDGMGRVMQDDIAMPAERNGSKFLALPRDRRCSIYARGKGTAEACYADFDPSREDTAALYCRPLWGGSYYPAEAPTITDISFARANAADADWKALVGENHVAGPAADVAALRVTAISKCAIALVADGPPPMRINLDGVASDAVEGARQGSVVEESVLTMESGAWYYKTTHRFSVLVQSSIQEKNHWLDIVVYDIANNRTERRVYLTVTNSTNNVTGDANLSAVQPRLFWLQAQTYGICQNLPSIASAGGLGATYGTELAFRMAANRYSTLANFPQIRGYEVWRSDGDDQNYKKVGTVNFAAPTRGVGEGEGNSYIYYFIYQDLSPDAVEDIMFYRVRAFNGNPASGGFSQFSNALRVSPLPPFTTSLEEPAHASVSKKLWPTFKYRITNKALYSPDLSDRMFFTLYLKDIHGDDRIFDGGFDVDFTELDEEGNPAIYFFDNFIGDWWYANYSSEDEEGNPIRLPFVWAEDDGAMVIDTDNNAFRYGIAYGAMVPGATYEWSIFGFEGGVLWVDMNPYPDNATHFYKDWPNPLDAPSDAEARAWSFASTAAYGLGAPNGFFTLIIDPDAK